jgi:Arc/MetJ-type ribon-helix-helix transcriptional regulator
MSSGEYKSANEVVAEALQLLERRQDEKAFDSVRRKIASGLRQLNRGDAIDGEAFFAWMKGKRKYPMTRRASRS